MTDSPTDVVERSSRLRSTLSEIWDHPRLGPALKLLHADCW